MNTTSTILVRESPKNRFVVLIILLEFGQVDNLSAEAICNY